MLSLASFSQVKPTVQKDTTKTKVKTEVKAVKPVKELNAVKKDTTKCDTTAHMKVTNKVGKKPVKK
jgi:hypothetical protein